MQFTQGGGWSSLFSLSPRQVVSFFHFIHDCVNVNLQSLLVFYFSHDAVIATAYPFLKECQNTLKQVSSAQQMLKKPSQFLTVNI